MVERDLAKVEAAGSSPVSRSENKRMIPKGIVLFCFSECGTDNKQHAPLRGLVRPAKRSRETVEEIVFKCRKMCYDSIVK